MSEFEVLVFPDRLSRRGDSPAVAANKAEREAIASRLGLNRVALFEAAVKLIPLGGGAVRATGTLRAVVEQVCVVSLDPFEQAVEEPFRLVFRPAAPEAQTEDEVDPHAEEDEIAFTGEAFDLGEALVESLALALDPYPRRPDAALPGPAEVGDEAEQAPARPNPFLALATKMARD